MKVRPVSIFILLYFSFFTSVTFTSVRCETKPDFAKTYSKFIKRQDVVRKSEYTWHHKTKDPFRELIVSWNAFRPKKGAFEVFVQVKHKTWSPEFKLAQWGVNSQQTFVNTRNRFVHVKHVRTELQRGRKAKEFKVKVLATGGANLKRLKAIFACASQGPQNFLYKKTEISLPDVWVKGVPRQSQMVLNHIRACDMCSPTSLAMQVSFVLKNKGVCKDFVGGLKDYVPILAGAVHDNSYLDIYGNWILNVAQGFHATKGKSFFRAERLNGFAGLHNYLQHDIPVAVSVRGKLKGGAKPYDNGHFMVVIGWRSDKKSIVCLDPAFGSSKKIVRAYNVENFLKHWGSNVSPNLAYVCLPVGLLKQKIVF